MPSLQEVEQFKNILNEMGDEPEILAERDEEIEDVSPPEQGLPEGLSDLLETPEGEAAEPAVEAADFEAAGEQPAAPPAAEQAPFPAARPEQEVDLSDLLGDQDLSDLDVLEGLELPEGEAQAPSTPEAEAQAEAPPEAEVPLEAGPAEILETEPVEGPEVAEAAEPATEEFSLEDSQTGPRIQEVLAAYDVLDMHTEEATLEDIFIQLTGKKLK